MMTCEVELFKPGQIYTVQPRWTAALQWLAKKCGYQLTHINSCSQKVFEDLILSAPMQEQELLLFTTKLKLPRSCHPQRYAICASSKQKGFAELTNLPEAVWYKLTELYPQLIATPAEQQVLLGHKPDIVEVTLQSGLDLSCITVEPAEYYLQQLLSVLGTPRSLIVWGDIPKHYWYPLFYGPMETTIAFRTLQYSRAFYFYLRQFLDWGLRYQKLPEALSNFAAWVLYCCTERIQYNKRTYYVAQYRQKKYYNLYPSTNSVRLLRSLLAAPRLRREYVASSHII